MTEQDNQSKPTVIDVEIDGEVKQFSAEDVKNLTAMQKSATDKFQKAAPAIKAAEALGFDSVEEFVEQSNMSLEAIHKLMQEGIIDPELNVVKKQEPNVEPDPFNQQQRPMDEDVIMKAISKIVDEKISPQTSGMAKRVEQLERVLASKALMERHPSLSKEAVGEVFMRASRDTSKKFLEHGDDVATASLSFIQEIESQTEKKIAEKLGITLDDLNKRKEQSPDGGASAIIQNKKAKFVERDKKWGKNKREDDVASPKEMMKEFMERQNFQ